MHPSEIAQQALDHLRRHAGPAAVSPPSGSPRPSEHGPVVAWLVVGGCAALWGTYPWELNPVLRYFLMVIASLSPVRALFILMRWQEPSEEFTAWLRRKRRRPSAMRRVK